MHNNIIYYTIILSILAVYRVLFAIYIELKWIRANERTLHSL